MEQECRLRRADLLGALAAAQEEKGKPRDAAFGCRRRGQCQAGGATGAATVDRGWTSPSATCNRMPRRSTAALGASSPERAAMSAFEISRRSLSVSVLSSNGSSPRKRRQRGSVAATAGQPEVAKRRPMKRTAGAAGAAVAGAAAAAAEMGCWCSPGHLLKGFKRVKSFHPHAIAQADGCSLRCQSSPVAAAKSPLHLRRPRSERAGGRRFRDGRRQEVAVERHTCVATTRRAPQQAGGSREEEPAKIIHTANSTPRARVPFDVEPRSYSGSPSISPQPEPITRTSSP